MICKKILRLIFVAVIVALMQNTALAIDYIFKIDNEAALLCGDDASLMEEECFSEDKAIAKKHGLYKTDDMSIIEKYMEMGLIEYYEEDAPAYLFDMPNTSEYMTIASGVDSSTIPLGRSYNQLNVQALWSLGFTGKGVTVGVIDSGVYPNVDLVDNLLPGVNVSKDIDTDPSKKNVTTDGYGHGTCVSGIIAANGNNYRGIAYEAKIIPIKAFTDSGSGNVSNMVKGIYAAVDDYGCDIINMSCGAKKDVEKDGEKTMKKAVEYAVSQGVTVVVAAGNGGGTSNTKDADYYPASYDCTISVANITVDDTHWGTSQENDGVDISAPGKMIYCLKNQTSGYKDNSGTSFSCPMVVGVATLILGYNPDITPAQMKALICNNATDLGSAGWDMSYGHGKVNCEAIVKELLDGKLYKSNIVEYKGTYNVAIRNGLDSVYSRFLAFANYSGNKMVGISTKSVSLAKGESRVLTLEKKGNLARLFDLNSLNFAP